MEEAGVEVTAQKKEHKKNIKILHVIFFLLVLSLAANVFLILKTGILTGYSINENFRYIQPLATEPIDANIQNSKFILQYQGLSSILSQEISEYNTTGGTVGIYLEDAQTGAWLGINERDTFTPASLLKTPVMIATLKKIQDGEMSLNDEITLLPQDLNSEYGTLYQKGAGAKINVSQLLEEMMAVSDNTAKNALLRQLTISEIDAVFTHVGISDPYINSTDQSVSPRGYERLFKSLYYSTYLLPKYSELGIELTMYDRGEDLISQGVPQQIDVAHKFGIFQQSGTLSDCGIVYHQENPYFLCIMTKNMDISSSYELIPKLSKDIYDFIDKKSN